jgi:hypothetical protein
MWKQGCIQLNQCPNSVHVPRHSPALRTHAHRPSSAAFNLQLQPPICLRRLTIYLQTLTKISTSQGGFSKTFEIFRKFFSLQQPICNSPSGTPILPMHLTILKVIESVFANVLQVTSPCKGTYCQKLQMFADVFLLTASQSGQLANVTTNMTLFCKCL